MKESNDAFNLQKYDIIASEYSNDHLDRYGIFFTEEKEVLEGISKMEEIDGNKVLILCKVIIGEPLNL
jgi:uncharacterized protein YutD